MYYYKSNDGVLAQSPLPISKYIEITEEEYLAIQEENQRLAEEQEKAKKEALLKQLMAELYLAE
jgi:hypothetical protein|nr:MAG TPA: hypothetical protein [Caudoviricetes sp.]